MKPHQGFTLVELIIVVALVGILAALATPSFTESIKNNRLQSTGAEMLGLLKFARSEAMRTGRGVDVVYTAATANRDPILSVNAPGTANVISQMEINRTLDTNTEPSVARFNFDGRGFLSAPAPVAGETTVNITVCDNRTGEPGRKIRLLASGFAAINTEVCP